MATALARISVISASPHICLPRGRLFYSTVSVDFDGRRTFFLSPLFRLTFSPRFGSAGCVIFWMVNFVGMLSVGLAFEAIIVQVYAPFFMITWLIGAFAFCNN